MTEYLQMTRAEYLKKHQDFRGTFEDGTPYLLVLDKKTGGTMLEAVKFTDTKSGK